MLIIYMVRRASKANYCAYNRSLKALAKKLRKNMTKGEACLWKYVLKARHMKGYSFRRQWPVLDYIADFMCKELLLIIEVDGISHELPGIAIKDKIRQNELEKAGFTVLRFSDDDVLTDINGVYGKISQWIVNREV